MNENYRRLYRNLLSQEQESTPGVRSSKIRRRIADYVENVDGELREDAKLLLHLLIEKMLVLPLFQGEKKKELDELWDDLEVDIKVILEHAFRNDQEQISGGSLLRSIAYCYPSLRVVKNAWWE